MAAGNQNDPQNQGGNSGGRGTGEAHEQSQEKETYFAYIREKVLANVTAKWGDFLNDDHLRVVTQSLLRSAWEEYQTWAKENTHEFFTSEETAAIELDEIKTEYLKLYEPRWIKAWMPPSPVGALSRYSEQPQSDLSHLGVEKWTAGYVTFKPQLSAHGKKVVDGLFQGTPPPYAAPNGITYGGPSTVEEVYEVLEASGGPSNNQAQSDGDSIVYENSSGGSRVHEYNVGGMWPSFMCGENSPPQMGTIHGVLDGFKIGYWGDAPCADADMEAAGSEIKERMKDAIIEIEASVQDWSSTADDTFSF